MSGSGTTRISASAFSLGEIGIYQVLFQVSVTAAGQLVLTLISTHSKKHLLEWEMLFLSICNLRIRYFRQRLSRCTVRSRLWSEW